MDYRTAKGWLKDAEREMLFNHSARVKPAATILNIGVEYGASLACLRAGNPTAKIIGVDIDCSKVLDSGYGCEIVQADSHELVKRWKQPLDLIFVDGDHGETGVLLDAGFADFLPVGGYILFQDCYDYDNPTIIHRVCPGVMVAVDKWFAAHSGEFWEEAAVDTTRVFRRVANVTRSSGDSADLQPGRTSKRKPLAS